MIDFFIILMISPIWYATINRLWINFKITYLTILATELLAILSKWAPVYIILIIIYMWIMYIFYRATVLNNNDNKDRLSWLPI